jgi:hypothetical protein
VDRESLDRAARCDAFIDKELRKVLMRDIQHAEDHLLLLGQQDAYEKVLAFLLEMNRRHRSRKNDTLADKAAGYCKLFGANRGDGCKSDEPPAGAGHDFLSAKPTEVGSRQGAAVRELDFERERSRAKKLY